MQHWLHENLRAPMPTRVPPPGRLPLGAFISLVLAVSSWLVFAGNAPGATSDTNAPQCEAVASGTFSPTLTWSTGRVYVQPPTYQYHVQVVPFSNDGPGIDLIRLKSREDSEAFEVRPPPLWYGLLPDLGYTWRVRLSDDVTATSPDHPAWGAWSDWCAFRTPGADSTSITAIAPTEGNPSVSLTPTLQWGDSNTATFFYEVQLSRDPAFTTDPRMAVAAVSWNLVHGGVNDPPNSYTVPSEDPLQGGPTYYWRVRPRIQGDGIPVAWTPPFSFTTVSTIIRADAGGPGITDAGGRFWPADHGFTDGNTATFTAPVERTVHDALYQTQRYGNFSYTLAAPNGDYEVTLKFAEAYWSSRGQRVFNVDIQGRRVLTHFDILAEAPSNHAVDVTFPAAVSNGTLTIAFISVVDHAVVSAILITQDSTSTPVPAPSPSPWPGPLPSNAVYFGIYEEGAAWNLSKQDAVESLVGKRSAIIPIALPWMINGGYVPFPASRLDAFRQRGSIPQIDWLGFDNCCGPDQPAFRNAAVAAGTHDAYLREFARAARAWGKPFFLKLNPEMNGNWTWPYSDQLNGNQPGDFVQAWRHVHDIFVQEGATNATWVWCAHTMIGSTAPIAQAYPGSPYVDWSCLHGYNWGHNAWGTSVDAWLSLTQVFTGSFLDWTNSYQQVLNLAPGKPMMLGEWASTEGGDDGTEKAAWIRDAFDHALPNNLPQVRAVVWYNVFRTGRSYLTDWRVNSTAKALEAYQQSVASTYYRSNQFATLSTTPIPPPTR